MKAFDVTVVRNFASVSSALLYFKRTFELFSCLDYFRDNSAGFSSFCCSYSSLVISNVRLEEAESELLCILRVYFFGFVDGSSDNVSLISTFYVYGNGKD